jgi:hypothetical protein
MLRCEAPRLFALRRFDARIGVLVALVLSIAPLANAQSGAEPEPPAITTRDLGLPHVPLGGDRCTTVSISAPELGPPVVVVLTGRTRVAVTYRRTITRSDVCGYDVYFPPEEETGVAVFTRAGRGWRRVAIGALPVESLGALTTIEHEGATFLVLGARRLEIAGRRVRFAP